MTKPKYSLNPITVDRNTWFYEEPKGLLVVHEARTRDGDYIQTDQFYIPWRKLATSVATHNAIRGREEFYYDAKGLREALEASIAANELVLSQLRGGCDDVSAASVAKTINAALNSARAVATRGK